MHPKILPTFLIALLMPTQLLMAAVPADTTLKVGQDAPLFFLKILDGQKFFLSKIVGPKALPQQRAPVILSFFTTFCLPCREEIPMLQQLRQQYPKLNVYLVNVSEEAEVVQAFVQKMGYSLPVLHDKYGVVSKKYQVKNTPACFIIDEQGRLVYIEHGFKPESMLAIRQVLNRLWSSRK